MFSPETLWYCFHPDYGWQEPYLPNLSEFFHLYLLESEAQLLDHKLHLRLPGFQAQHLHWSALQTWATCCKECKVLWSLKTTFRYFNLKKVCVCVCVCVCFCTRVHTCEFIFGNYLFWTVSCVYNIYIFTYLLSCVWLGDLLDCSLPVSSVHGISQARILEWVAISFSRGSS